jgi:hypothetical protein
MTAACFSPKFPPLGGVMLPRCALRAGVLRSYVTYRVLMYHEDRFGVSAFYFAISALIAW